ncbi:MAG: DUF2914 domain-containing protein [Methylomonas sp.]|nr:DUF2914 domain-containing protein [Methylomonas sp.]PPD21957.1 MAG: hypothetical protein CTY23_03830 [Methylomonas sp.]PPD25739.1 MAG: hypothetical protein CTY22_07565 [Methylomonas sp.]PPD36992.1 MAG: hypothetical protein CTY21_07565 [Methylomonas sp.]PPD39106.1 MAG: hypothetical protein CTY17_08410 [Methylomonas sp.]
MSENRLVVKVNYGSENRRRKALIDPKMITVWHTQRIVCALALVLIILFFMGKWLFTDELAPSDNPVSEQVQSDSQNIAAPVTHDTGQAKAGVKAVDTVATVSYKQKTLSAVIFDKRVIRAALGKAPVSGEPGLPVDSPVSLTQADKTELFYFSEPKNSKDKILSHHWLKEGRLIQKQPFDVKKGRRKLVSSRVFTIKDIGQWKVVLVDKEGKLLSEVNFYIDSQ